MNRDKINRLIKQISLGKNWIEAFNKLEDELLERYLDKLVEVTNFKEKEFNNLYISVYELQEKVDDVDMFDIEKLIANIKKFQNEYRVINKEYKKAIENYSKELDIAIKCLKVYKEEFDNTLRIYTSGNYRIDYNIFYSRVCLSDKKVKCIVKNMELANLAINSDIDYLNDSITILINFATRKVDRLKARLNERELQLIKRKTKYKKIFDYKEMVKLAEKNNFEYVRSKGDHDIYMHKDTYKIVVIPQHDLGYGLMMDIQKQIQNRCVA